jgi:hypothetical protein
VPSDSQAHPRAEVEAVIDRYHEMRRRIDAGLEPNGFGSLADFYTDDAVYVDAAWGRIEGKKAIAHWLEHSMVGLMDWKFRHRGRRRHRQVDPDHPRDPGRRLALHPVGLLTTALRR